MKTRSNITKSFRGKSQTKHMNVQMVAAEKLAQCPLEMWDIMLSENTLEEAGQHLCGWLEQYWAATHPPPRQSLLSAVALGPLTGMVPNITAFQSMQQSSRRHSLERSKSSGAHSRVQKLRESDHEYQQMIARYEEEC